MKIVTEELTATQATATDVDIASGGSVDAKLASAGFYPPQIAAASLPTASGVEGMIVYDTTNNKLVVSNGSAWETITSST